MINKVRFIRLAYNFGEILLKIMEFNLFRYWLDIGLDTEFSTKIQKNLDGLFCNEILQ